MMIGKQAYYTAIAAAMIAGFASCSSDELVTAGGGDTVVTLTAQLPGGLSRAYGDGTTAETLQYAVYESGKKTPLAVHENGATVGTATFDNRVANVSVTLTQGKSYDFVFWAQAKTEEGKTSPYTFDATTQSVSVDYSDVNANDEALDAFYAHTTITVDGNGKTVELKRPFAQINVCTTDLAAANASGFDATHTTVVVKGASNALDLMQEIASGNETVTFKRAAVANSECTTDKHSQLSMNYVLVGKEGASVDVLHTTHHMDGESEKSHVAGEYTSVPVKANYKTHIYGALLTNPVEYEVKITPAFDGTEDNIEIWDGTSKSAPSLNADGTAYEITSAAEFAYVLANGGNVTTTSRASNTVKTFYITKNLNMGSNVLPLPSSTGDKYYGCVFDFQGNTIENFKTEKSGNCTGIFAESVVITVKNLNVNNATIGSASPTGDQYAGVVLGICYGATLENVKVSNSTVNGVNKVGGIVGYNAEEPITISGCSVDNTAVNGIGSDGGACGGIIGYTTGSVAISNSTVQDITISAPDGPAETKRGSGYIIGTVDLSSDESATISDCIIAGENNMDSNYSTNDYVGADRNGNANITIEEVNADLCIASLADLKAFAASVNEGNSYYGKKVVLVCDIDLKKEEWTPIGNESNPFKGTFDGRNCTISNLYINAPKANYIGLFGNTNSGEVKNLTVHNATLKGRLFVGTVSGYPYTSKYNNITVTGDVKIDAMSYVGGILGKNLYVSSSNLTVNVNKGSYVSVNSIENGTEYRSYVGGVVGFMGEGSIVVSNATSNIDVIGTTCDVGGITGIAHYDNTFENCSSSGNIKVTYAYPGKEYEVGGIAGVWHNANSKKVTFTNCSFTGTLSSVRDGNTFDVSGNTITGCKYSATDTGELYIDGVLQNN